MLSIALLSVSAFAQTGSSHVGGKLSLATKTEGAGLGIVGWHYFDRKWRGEANVNHFFGGDGGNMWDVNVNAHYVAPVAHRLSVYPIMGLSFTSWSVERIVGIPASSSSVAFDTTRENRLGLNLGIGGEYQLDKIWTATGELKLQTAGGFTQGVLAFGIVYRLP